MAKGVKWTRDHLLIALNLYHKIPFGKMHARNPAIIELARRMGRTPGSLAMKFINLASLDPVHQARGVTGLSHSASADREIWEAFQADPDAIKIASETALQALFRREGEEVGVEVLPDGVIIPAEPLAPRGFDGPTTRESVIQARRDQQYFCQVVLNAYGGRCCISGVALIELRSSHIIPWAVAPEIKAAI